ncbi:hypothetical protein ADL03_24485 [Nocardia sp. NRRL S-836]|nr:hypothetical protein ADL03_24485 [Nocardia sp. NRRL S-836]
MTTTSQHNLIVAPHVTSWSAEQNLQCGLIVRPDRRGVGYVNELPGDRDEHGVLWVKVAERHGAGKPDFARVHPARQRQAMKELLCQVCAKPADRTSDGVLWLMRDHRETEDPDWPEHMASVEPPTCVPCIEISLRRCPALRRGAVAVRVHEYSVMGVRGTLYKPGVFAPEPLRIEHLVHGDALAGWMVAASSFRLLQKCSFVSFEELGIAADLG